MAKVFLIILLGLISLFSVKSLFKPLQKPAKSPTFKKDPSEPDTEMVADPQCGVYVDPRTALRLELNGKAHHFCSEACRDKFREKHNG
jgi:uncharacterized protein